MRHTTLHTLLLLVALAALTGCEDDGPRVGGLFFDGGPALDGATPPDPSECGASDTVGVACETTAECNDGCFCNGLEVCMAGTCQRPAPAPCDDGVECTSDVCNEEERRCEYEPDDSLCADGDLCNGTEVCAPGIGCTAGPRLSCVDGDPCTIGSCSPDEGCSFEIRDLDGDGYTDARCGGDDCNDDPLLGGSVQPGAVEICDNGLDDDCDRLVDYREPECLAVNDTCAERETLAVPGSWVRTTRGASSQYPIGCMPSGIDTVFEFSLTETSDVGAFVRTESGDGAVSIRAAGECATGADLACGEEARGRALPAGDYVAIVRTSTPTAFDLLIDINPPSDVGISDQCNDATTDITAGGAFNGFFADVADDYALACRTGGSTRDAAYRLELTESSDVTLRASVNGGSGSATTFLSLTRDCTSAASALACVQRANAELTRRSVPPGVYYVLLEASDPAAVGWTLDATITPAAPRNEGDACSTSADITNTMVSLPIDMLELDSGTTCGGATSASRDASFFYTVTETSDVVLTTDVGATHFVNVSDSCGNLTTERFCTSGTPTITERLLRVAPGTYHVTVSTALTSGTIQASAMLEAPTFPPANDDCAGATDLMDGMIVSGDLTAAADDVVGCAGAGKADTFHRLVLTERKNVSLIARRMGGAGEPLAIGLRREAVCSADGSDLLCTSGAPAFLNRTLDPGTYYVAVESASVLGPYTLALYLANP